MTNEQKLAILREQTYNNFDLQIKEENGTILVNCWVNGDFYPLDEIRVINYQDEMIPVSLDEMDECFRQCACCGEWIFINDDDYLYANDTGNYFHDHSPCNENVYWCDYHGEYEENELTEVNVDNRYNNEYWCESALENHAFYCERSEEWYSDRAFDSVEVHFNDYTETWEYSQAEENAYYCEECGQWYSYHMWDDDADMCCNCVGNSNRAVINAYHTSKNNDTLTFFGESKYTNWAGTGFELEVDTSYQNAQDNQQNLLNALKEKFGDRITFERDGSLNNGFEIISAPHTKDEMANVDWADLLNTCKEHGYISHDAGTCGLHFHVSGYMFGATLEKQHDTIAKVIAFYEYFFNDFVKLSRRGGEVHWANKYGIRYDGDIDTYKAKCKEIVYEYARGWYSDRYKAINLTNRGSDKLFKTVEFRINRGTLNANTFYASYDLIMQLIKNAKKIDWTSPDFFNPKKWLSGCKSNTYAYIVKRNAFEGVFYLPQTNAETEYTQENV
jgi:hypothetical protein